MLREPFSSPVSCNLYSSSLHRRRKYSEGDPKSALAYRDSSNPLILFDVSYLPAKPEVLPIHV